MPVIVLVVLNLGANPAQGRIQIAAELGANVRYDFEDVFHQQLYMRDLADLNAHGLYVRLDGFDMHVFAIAPSTA